MSRYSDTKFLSDLACDNHAPAWAAFLRANSSLIFKVIRGYEADESRIRDGYLFVCDKLSESQFRRLRKFDVDGPAAFSA